MVFIVFCWVILLFDFAYQLDLNDWGIHPRTVRGLVGIVFSPFLHGGPGHLFSNSIPFLVSGAFIFHFFPADKWRIIGIIWFFSGLGVWLYGKFISNHIGASGLVYGMVSFLLTSGIIRKNKSLSAVVLLLIFLYGSMVWGVFPQIPVNPGESISWEGHLAGTVAGVILAYVYRKKGPEDDKFFEEDEDEDVESLHPDDPFYHQTIIDKEQFNIQYHLKDNRDELPKI